DLAVQGHAGLAQPGDEAGVADALLPRGGVDARDPQAAELGLLVAAVAVGVVGGGEQRLGGDADARRAEPPVALGPREDLGTAAADGTGLGAWHLARPHS